MTSQHKSIRVNGVEKSLVESFIIPKCTGKGFIVKKGQVLRIIESEGKQVPDVTFLNADNFKESYDAHFTYYLNCIEGTGNWNRVQKLYSKPPWERVMLTIVDDKAGAHPIPIGGHCSRRAYELREQSPSHRSCSDNLEDAMKPFGLGLEDIGDIFNIWMNIEILKDGCMRFHPPNTQKGDYIDLLAEINCLVGVSACPSDHVATNDFVPKSIGIEIYE